MQGLTTRLYVNDELVSELLCGNPSIGVDGDVLPEEANEIQSKIAMRARVEGKDVRLEVWDPDEPEEAGPLLVVSFSADKARFN